MLLHRLSADLAHGPKSVFDLCVYHAAQSLSVCVPCFESVFGGRLAQSWHGEGTGAVGCS